MSDLSILGVQYDDGDHGPQRRGNYRRQRRSGKGGAVIALVVVLVLVAVIGFAGKNWISGKFGTPDYSGDGAGTVEVQVKQGDSSRDIAATLAKLDVVKSEKAFNKAAADDASSRNIQPGFYRLRHQMSAAAALSLLEDPSSRLNTKVTIPEGLSAREIYALLEKKTRIPAAQFLAAARNPQALGARAGVKNVEGMLFPATYDFDPGTSAADMLKEMVGTFTARVDVAALARAGAPRGLNWYQVLTEASLLEKEAITVDFGKTATVIDNRLKDHVRLGLDSTINYALHRNNVRVPAALTNISSPYNTYRNYGLPPTPIANPGETAISAAMQPTPGPWLYFVKIDKAGHTYFTADYNDFLTHKAQAQANGVY